MQIHSSGSLSLSQITNARGRRWLCIYLIYGDSIEKLSNRPVISHPAPLFFFYFSTLWQILNCNTLSCISFSNESVNLSVNWQQKNTQNTHFDGAKVFSDLFLFCSPWALLCCGSFWFWCWCWSISVLSVWMRLCVCVFWAWPGPGLGSHFDVSGPRLGFGFGSGPAPSANGLWCVICGGQSLPFLISETCMDTLRKIA